MLDLEAARELFPTLQHTAYFNTAAVGLGSTRLKQAFDIFTEDWLENGFDYLAAEARGEECRVLFSSILAVDKDDIALIRSAFIVSARDGGGLNRSRCVDLYNRMLRKVKVA